MRASTSTRLAARLDARSHRRESRRLPAAGRRPRPRATNIRTRGEDDPQKLAAAAATAAVPLGAAPRICSNTSAPPTASCPGGIRARARESTVLLNAPESLKQGRARRSLSAMVTGSFISSTAVEIDL